MSFRRVAVVFGTRPEIIKLAPVIFSLRREKIPTLLISTSQHKELLKLAMDTFGIEPDIDLDIMSHNQTLLDITQRALEGLYRVLNREKPDLVLAQGDTTTVFATALASFYLKIPFGHVEAGLRTNELYSPYPEEANRQLTSRISALNFAPTELSARNLREEKVPGRVFVTGNTVVDALEYIKEKHLSRYSPSPPLDSLGNREFILVEVHRRESFGQPIREILLAVRDLLRYFKIVFPVHLNPNVREAVKEIFGVTPPYYSDSLLLLEPLDYLTMLWLISRAKLIITDSGGLQEEAPSFSTPVIVTREVTERPEGIDEGFIFLLGRDRRRIFDRAMSLMRSNYYRRLENKRNPYGDGKASLRIVDVIKEFLKIG